RVNTAGGRAFADFMLAPGTQAVIKTFGLERLGQPLFVPIAGKTDSDLQSVDLLVAGVREALPPLPTGDREGFAILWLPAHASGLVPLLPLALGIPPGTPLAFLRFHG